MFHMFRIPIQLSESFSVVLHCSDQIMTLIAIPQTRPNLTTARTWALLRAPRTAARHAPGIKRRTAPTVPTVRWCPSVARSGMVARACEGS